MRETHQIVYMLNIRKLAIRLDRADWAIISRIFLCLVIESLEAKLLEGTSQEARDFLARVRGSVGDLNE